jgi:hypothetical protein
MSAPLKWPDRIGAALEETANAFRALWTARDRKAPTSARVKLSRLADEAAARSNALQAECREAFAKSRGWRRNKTGWTRDQSTDAYGIYSRQIVHHAEFYDAPEQKQFALVTHTAATKEEIAHYAARRGYRAELLPFSWECPGYYSAVVFTLKPGARWPR